VWGSGFGVQGSGLGLRFRVAVREFFIDNLLVRINFIIEMVWWTGLAPWEFDFPFPGSLISTFLDRQLMDCKTLVGRRVAP